MSDIFLSHSDKDKARAQKIAEALEARGCSVWWDRVIPPGKTFDEVIEQELDAAKCVIVLWSHESVKSKWVKTEASEGDRRSILVPVLVEEGVKIPLAFRLIEAANLIEWEGTLPHPEFDLLLDSISKILGRPLEEKIYTNSIGLKFELIPAGEFMMGSEEYYFEKPVHRVKISKPFYLGIYLVTQKEWKAVMGNDHSAFEGDDLPVEQVSWDDVQEFIKKLNEKEGRNKYRLPSESEWEYAARAGTTTRYSFGDDESKLGDYAWYDANSDSKTHEVGQKKPNPWGLYDMHGNVWEWVQDADHISYNGAPTDGSAWERDGFSPVFRGGGWAGSAWDCRSARRYSYFAHARLAGVGFRLLRIL